MDGVFSLLLRALTATCLLAAAWPAGAQQVTLERDTPLHAEARLDAKVVTTLKQGTPGEVVAKSGAWLHIKTAEASGWLFSFNVRFAPAAASSASGDAAALGRLFASPNRVHVTSTIGVRGLEEDDLRQARFDGAQMRLLDQYAATPEQAGARARESGLTASRVDYFDGQTP